MEYVVISIMFINDNDPQLFLNGTNLVRDYQIRFLEGQDYLGGAIPISLSDNLIVVDEDAGPQVFLSAQITQLDGELWNTIQTLCVPYSPFR